MNRFCSLCLSSCSPSPRPNRTPSSRSFTDRLSFNPAFAGAERLQYVNAFYRNQWSGLDLSPTTALFNTAVSPALSPAASA